jgi:diguanylate cyclase (GGDEF)-like protein
MRGYFMKKIICLLFAVLFFVSCSSVKSVNTKSVASKKTEDEKQIKVTISMGLAEFNTKETGEALFERADKALYMAKTNGRNQVVSSD